MTQLDAPVFILSIIVGYSVCVWCKDNLIWLALQIILCKNISTVSVKETIIFYEVVLILLCGVLF